MRWNTKPILIKQPDVLLLVAPLPTWFKFNLTMDK